MKKIMFNDKYGLTDAVLEGRKTMTRRVVNIHDADEVGIWDAPYITIYKDGRMLTDIMPTYKVGEVVAVAQPYKDVASTLHFMETCLANEWRIGYRDAGWNNKMFVKPCLMPHQIRITDIKVERLQDISSENCLREGVYCDNIPQYLCDGYESIQKAYFAEGIDDTFKCPIDAFAALIDKVSGNGTWESNPWVFAYEFELIK